MGVTMGPGSITRRSFIVGGGVLLAGLAGAGVAWGAESPPIVDCDGWGARPNSDIVNVVNQRPVQILVHHTATPNVEDHSRGAADDLARGIQNFHMDSRGWIDSGQHFTISRGGLVLEGRRRSLEALRSGRKQVEAAHCTGQNLVSIGIENEGTYLDTGPPQALWDRLREMCAYICGQYGVAPTEIFGHRDFKDTACPGDVLYGMLPQLRGEVGGLLGKNLEGSAARAVSWPLLREGDRGPVVTAAQHLLRHSGYGEVTPDGDFGPATADVVRLFQTDRSTEEINGMIGGESWPLLVAPPDGGRGGVAAALAAVSLRGAERSPTEADWKRVLTVAAR